MKLLTAEEAAARLRMCKKTFLKLRLPVHELSARKHLYSEETLDAFARSRLQCTEPEDGKRPGRRRKAKILQRGVPRVFTPHELLSMPQEGKG